MNFFSKDKKRKVSSISIDNHNLTVKEPPALNSFFYYFVLVYLGLFGCFGSFFSSFDIPLNLTAFYICMPVFTLIALVCMSFKKASIILTLAALTLWTGVLIWLGSDIVDGVIHIINAVARKYNSMQSRIQFGFMAAEKESYDEMTAKCTTFALCLMFIYAFLFVWLLKKKQSKFRTLLAIIPFITIPFIYTIVPDSVPLAALLCFCTFIMFNTLTFRRKSRSSRGKKRFHGAGYASVRVLSIALIPLLLFPVFVISVVFPADTYTRPEELNHLRKGIMSGNSLGNVFKTDIFKGTTEKLDLDSIGNLRFTGKTDLKVQYYSQYGEYLKGFTGSVFTGSSWEKISDEDYSEIENMLNDFKVQSFPSESFRLFPDQDFTPWSALDFMSSSGSYFSASSLDFISTAKDEQTISVENIGTNPRIIYMPYAFSGISDENSNIVYDADGGLKSNNFIFGTEKYSLQSAMIDLSQYYGMSTFDDFIYLTYWSNFMQDTFSDELNNGLHELNEKYPQYEFELTISDRYFSLYEKNTPMFSDYIDDRFVYYNNNSEIIADHAVRNTYETVEISEIINEFYSEMNEKIYSELDEIGTSKMLDELKDFFSDEEYNYLRAQVDYTKFIEDYYTRLPDGMAEDLSSFYNDKILPFSRDSFVGDSIDYISSSALYGDSYGSFYGEGDITSIINNISNYFSTNYSYTLSPGETPEGKGFVDYFLNESKKGYCVHFATAAAAILRSQGIPCRYATGYVCPATNNSTLTESNGWVEIPDSNAHAWVEIYRPGVGWLPVEFTPGVSDGDINHEANEENYTGGDVEEENTTEATSPETSEGDSGVTTEPPMNNTTTKSISNNDEPESQAFLPIVIVVSALIVALITLVLVRSIRLSKRKKSFADRDHNKAAIAIYGYIQKLLKLCKVKEPYDNDIPDELYDIVLKARFSQHTITADELRQLKKHSVKLTNECKENITVIQKLKCRWIYALF